MAYVESLCGDAKARYLCKIQAVGVDPYSLDSKEWLNTPECLPDIVWGDIIHYLVYGISQYTMEQFKAFKSLEAYNQFVCGWVKGLSVTQRNGLSILLGKVMCYIYVYIILSVWIIM